MDVRPIDANAIVNYHVKCTDGREYVLLPVKSLAEYPTLDYAPVRHGEWIHYTEGHDQCSFCGKITAIFSGGRDFCPNCGAKMDGGKATCPT